METLSSNKQIESITKNIFNRLLDLNTDDPSLFSGNSGILIYLTEYYKVYNSDQCYEKIEILIQSIIDGLNKTNNISFSNGITGITWTLNYLIKEGILDSDPSILNSIDKILENDVQFYFDSKDWDYLHGYLGIGFYFLERNRFDIVDRIVQELDTSKISDENGYSWESHFMDQDECKKIYYPISLAHGSSSIVSFLIRCRQSGYSALNIQIDELIKGSVKYILNQRKNYGVSWFPHDMIVEISENLPDSRLAWCHGDLGIIYTLFEASLEMEDNELYSICLELSKGLINRKTTEDTKVKDACVCHGSSGNAIIFHLLYNLTNENIFIDTRDYWIKETLNYDNQNKGQNFLFIENAKLETRLNTGLFDGESGVGLALLSIISGSNCNWTKILLLK